MIRPEDVKLGADEKRMAEALERYLDHELAQTFGSLEIENDSAPKASTTVWLDIIFRYRRAGWGVEVIGGGRAFRFIRTEW